ncbi:hypothetical protein PDIG_36320 [Penicillium digitatum PHI26]|uniref:Uncharacterized protein n=2 Tax=Penicillium digitatum TaxID=36651 RepID=K9GKG8_PEND2|nr:hypothetical protein PDIP_05170 [Penicillium digitatum Pd1]EKV13721.1 hypothetical protein PDIG_36320 [Penicillium digitatum PHI26]EKV21572.1 hypothetical protein PDIP_05170 [Penicillium digitatum Pd1]
MESCLSAAISYLMVLKLEPWDTLHIRQEDEQTVRIGAIGWKLDIPLHEMKGSIFGCAFLLDHGGYFWCTICHALQHWRNPEWKPLSGTDGLRVARKTQRGILYLCPVLYSNTSALVPFSMLEMTTPGRIMIWQAEHPDSQYTPKLKAELLLQLLKAALIGNGKYFWRLLLGFAIFGQRFLLVVTAMTQSMVHTVWQRTTANSFEALE